MSRPAHVPTLQAPLAVASPALWQACARGPQQLNCERPRMAETTEATERSTESPELRTRKKRKSRQPAASWGTPTTQGLPWLLLRCPRSDTEREMDHDGWYRPHARRRGRRQQPSVHTMPHPPQRCGRRRVAAVRTPPCRASGATTAEPLAAPQSWATAYRTSAPP